MFVVTKIKAPVVRCLDGLHSAATYFPWYA